MKKSRVIWVVLGMVKRLSPGLLSMLMAEKLMLTAIPYVNILFSSRIIDAMLERQPFETIFQDVLWMVFLNFILNIAGWGLSKLVNIRKYVLGDQVQKMISEKALSIDYELLEKKETLEYISKAKDGMRGSGDIGNFCDSISDMVGVIGDIVYSVILFLPAFVPIKAAGGSVLYRFFNSAWSAGLLFIILAIQLVILFLSSKRFAELGRENFEKNVDGNRRFGYLMSLFQEYANGKDIRMYHYADMIMENFFEWVPKLVNNFRRMQKKMNKYIRRDIWCVGVFAAASYVYMGAKAWFGMVSVGNVTRYVGAFTQFSSALGRTINFYTNISIQAQYLSYFMDFMNIENKKYDGTLPVEKRDDNEYEFEFRNVSFSYPNSEKPVLDHISIKLKIGSKLAVVGPNGAGKTTFIKLLCRLYDPTEGEILLNGIDIRYYDYNEYLNLFSVVFQDFKLFSFSIAENVAVSKEYNEVRVRDCLDKAGFSERLDELEDNIHTNLYQLEENSVEISGGEAQKIAIARALYKNSPLVILDEPTSALDPVSEYEIYQSFDELVDERTAIYISHRMSSCRFCHQIVVFDNGKIVQQGSHDELVEEKDGLYYEMWSAQAQYYN